MCRLLAYVGPPDRRPRPSSPTRPTRCSRQCTAARLQTSGCENPDGWGIGWYEDGAGDAPPLSHHHTDDRGRRRPGPTWPTSSRDASSPTSATSRRDRPPRSPATHRSSMAPGCSPTTASSRATAMAAASSCTAQLSPSRPVGVDRRRRQRGALRPRARSPRRRRIPPRRRARGGHRARRRPVQHRAHRRRAAGGVPLGQLAGRAARPPGGRCGW